MKHVNIYIGLYSNEFGHHFQNVLVEVISQLLIEIVFWPVEMIIR